ncbi:MAG: hypothetical protein ACO3UV_13145, partial [Pseudomonadales bacterium]
MRCLYRYEYKEEIFIGEPGRSFVAFTREHADVLIKAIDKEMEKDFMLVAAHSLMNIGKDKP